MGKLFLTRELFTETVTNLSERIGWNMKCLREDGKVERWRVKRHRQDDGNDFIEIGRYIINVPLLNTAVYPSGETELDVLWNTITNKLHLRPYFRNKKEMVKLQYCYPTATRLLTAEQAEKFALMMLHAAIYEGTKMTLNPIISRRQYREENNIMLADSLLHLLTNEGAEVTQQDIIEELEYSAEEGGHLDMPFRFSKETIERLREKYQTAPYLYYKPDHKSRRILLFEGAHVVEKRIENWVSHRLEPAFIDCYTYTGKNNNPNHLRRVFDFIAKEGCIPYWM